jgi:DNA-3-methyladenine glycosylase
MAITRARDNGKDVSTEGDLVIVDDGFHPKKIARTPRVGITKAAEEKRRYVISGNPFVSAKRR